MVEDDYIPKFRHQLIKCEGCPVEAIRDVWLRWGLACPECGKKKMAV